MRKLIFALGIALIAALEADTLAQTTGPLLVIELPSDSVARGTIIENEINFTELLSAAESKASFDPTLIHVCELKEEGARGEGVLHQFEPALDYDAKKNARGVLVLEVNRDGARRFGVWLGNAPQELPSAESLVLVNTSADAIEIRNEFFSIVHPVKGNGGLPNRITFLATGKDDDTLVLNDRLFKRGDRCYWLKHDTSPLVAVVSKGPVRTTVRIAAHYMSDEGERPGNAPEAVYTFSYYPDKPYVKVTAEVSQEESFEWDELHFLELHHKEPLLPNWALGKAAQTGAFKDLQKGFSGRDWGVMYDDNDALGLVSGGRTLIYDGTSGYGTYLHGPWIPWDGTSWRAVAWIYVGPSKGSYEAVEKLCDELLTEELVLVYCPPLERLMTRASEAIRQLPKPVGVLLAGRLCLARQLIRSGKELTMAKNEIEQTLERCAKKQWKGLKATEHSAVEQEDGLIHLASESVRISLDTKAGTICGIYSSLTDQEFISPESPSPLCELVFRRDDLAVETEISLASTQFSSTCEVDIQWSPDGKPTMGLRWPALDIGDEKGMLDASVSIVPGEDGRSTEWKIALVNRSKTFGLWRLDFPMLKSIDCSLFADGSIVYPHGWGISSPLRSPLRGMFTYPSGACNMQFAAVTVGKGGLYLGAHDGAAGTKQLRVMSGGDGTTGGCFWTHYPPGMGKPASEYQLSYPVVLSVFAGSWYDAARIYRDWVLKQEWCANGPLHSRADIPDCVKKIGTWVHSSGDPEPMLQNMLAFQERFKVPVAVHWYCWHQIPFDNDYPHYFPPKDGFRDAVARATARGILVKPYINGRLWDSDTESFAERGRIYCTKNERLDPYIEVYGSGEKLVPMCPHTEFWQEKVKEIVTKLVCDLGVSGVYIDQIAAAAPRLCFDPYHGHPLGGGEWWVEGYWKMLSAIRETIRKQKPNAFLTSEASAEPYMAYVDAYLVCQTLWGQSGRIVPLFSTVYHDRAITFGRYIFRHDLKDGLPYYMKLGQMFACGVQLGWLGFEVLQDEFKEQADYLDKLARCRMRALKFLAWGEMLRPLTFEKPLPAVQAVYRRFRRGGEYRYAVELDAVQSSVWRGHDRTVGLAFTNITDKAITFSFTFDAVSYGMPKAKKYSVIEISPTGTRTLASYDTPAFKRTATLEAHDVRVLEVRTIQ